MIPELVPPRPSGGENVETFKAWVGRWRIGPDLGVRLTMMQERLPFRLKIISGYRTREEQDALRQEGRPAARDDLSTHRQCPATGADLLPVDITITDYVKAVFGAAATQVGLRWGGGSAPDEKGIPSDWNHVDGGPVNPDCPPCMSDCR